MDWILSTESSLTQSPNKLDLFWHKHINTGVFKGSGELDIAYAWCVPENAHATVVISSGRIESYLKYKEVIWELFVNGFAVFILDHRGQGLSERMTDNPHYGYVADFYDYVADFSDFITHIVRPNEPSGPRFLLAHSMGSAIGALTLLSSPDCFHRAVFCSPMFGIRPALPKWLSRRLLTWVGRRYQRAGKPTGYFIGQKNYHPHGFAGNRLTHSEIRYQLFRELYAQVPEIQLGGVTVSWLQAALTAMDEIHRRANELTVPALILSAQKDTVVDNKKQSHIARFAPNTRLITIPQAYHELLMESDPMRMPVMSHILQFFSEQPE
ncbi:alpha/beta fold hydrolase [Alteromonas sp. 14N.309.X.WAT.G.H12]|uniref:alpha/beta fold hydrolase n=1 Tax=Alteromonas sp. 14N.309.X.WAT.G.H12 TaxID=3120824 RepID=UPI002FD55F84